MKDLNSFIESFSDSLNNQSLVKLTLSDRRVKGDDLKNVFIKPVALKAGMRLSFVYRYTRRDVTKNYEAKESETVIREMLESNFYKADLYATANDIHLDITKSGKLSIKTKPPTFSETPDKGHDHKKKRLIETKNNLWLRELGITTKEGNVKADKQDKFRQINKYAEIVENVIQDANLPESAQITDMGAGKGYLTFALYDFLVNQLHLSPRITGVEIREELVEKCNTVAVLSGLTKLQFVTGSIESTELPRADMLIALHACDTATDQAIYRGIKDDARIIICAPCCHKQIRRQMHPTGAIKPITQYGILEERQAEILTDTIRALIMELYGYKTKVFEFISTEHTAKNVLIVGIKRKANKVNREEILNRIKNLKVLFGIEYHFLEKLLLLN